MNTSLAPTGDVMPFVPLDFPREVLEMASNGQQAGRYIVKSWNELERYWKSKNGSGNVYFTMYGYRATKPPRNHRVDYETPVIHHFVMDFDCKDFKRRGAEVEFGYMHEQVKRLHTHLLQENIRHFVWFSGGGFHIWVPLAETYMPSNGNEVKRIREGGRKLMAQWHNELDLGCNDPTVAFDTSGMIRIPNSYNARRGCWSIPLESEEILTLDHDGLMETAQVARSGYIEHGTESVAITLPKQRNRFKRTVEKVEGLPDVTLNDIVVLPCLAGALGEGNPIHKARFHLVAYLAARFRWFHPPEAINDHEKQEHATRICDIISKQNWVDYDPDITQKHVESIVFGGAGNKGYCASSCATIEYDGLCVGKCRYHDGSMGET